MFKQQFLIIASLCLLSPITNAAILLTGGTGYIGSHVAVTLLQNNHEVVLLDNLSNSERSVVERIETASGHKVSAFYALDLLDKEKLNAVFSDNDIQAVIHFAGFKSVSESVKEPLLYYQNNIASTLTLLEVMAAHDCHKLIFSSSATVYGEPEHLPLDENHRTNPSNPYGRTKLMIEEVLRDVAIANTSSQFIALRYFNPVGAHKSGLIGEKPNGVPQNLVPYMLEVVQGKRPYLRLFGDDYPTKDGTAIRDFIHILDLADGHLLALNSVLGGANAASFRVYNLGTGRGYSVKEMVDGLSRALGKPLPYLIEARRPGDLSEVYSNPDKAKRELGFVATRTLEEMLQDSLNWSSALSAFEMPSNSEL